MCPSNETKDVPKAPIDEENTPTIGQYRYNDFTEVIHEIKHIIDIHGPGVGADFERFLNLRRYYFEQGEEYRGRSVECMIKNHVGIRRFNEEYPDLLKANVGNRARFFEGRFIGWKEEDRSYLPLKGLTTYVIE
jgi:hypothetical protein